MRVEIGYGVRGWGMTLGSWWGGGVWCLGWKAGGVLGREGFSLEQDASRM